MMDWWDTSICQSLSLTEIDRPCTLLEEYVGFSLSFSFITPIILFVLGFFNLIWTQTNAYKRGENIWDSIVTSKRLFTLITIIIGLLLYPLSNIENIDDTVTLSTSTKHILDGIHPSLHLLFQSLPRIGYALLLCVSSFIVVVSILLITWLIAGIITIMVSGFFSAIYITSYTVTIMGLIQYVCSIIPSILIRLNYRSSILHETMAYIGQLGTTLELGTYPRLGVISTIVLFITFGAIMKMWGNAFNLASYKSTVLSAQLFTLGIVLAMGSFFDIALYHWLILLVCTVSRPFTLLETNDNSLEYVYETTKSHLLIWNTPIMKLPPFANRSLLFLYRAISTIHPLIILTCNLLSFYAMHGKSLSETQSTYIQQLYTLVQIFLPILSPNGHDLVVLFAVVISAAYLMMFTCALVVFPLHVIRTLFSVTKVDKNTDNYWAVRRILRCVISGGILWYVFRITPFIDDAEPWRLAILSTPWSVFLPQLCISLLWKWLFHSGPCTTIPVHAFVDSESIPFDSTFEVVLKSSISTLFAYSVWHLVSFLSPLLGCTSSEALHATDLAQWWTGQFSQPMSACIFPRVQVSNYILYFAQPFVSIPLSLRHVHKQIQSGNLSVFSVLTVGLVGIIISMILSLLVAKLYISASKQENLPASKTTPQSLDQRTMTRQTNVPPSPGISSRENSSLVSNTTNKDSMQMNFNRRMSQTSINGDEFVLSDRYPKSLSPKPQMSQEFTFSQTSEYHPQTSNFDVPQDDLNVSQQRSQSGQTFMQMPSNESSNMMPNNWTNDSFENIRQFSTPSDASARMETKQAISNMTPSAYAPPPDNMEDTIYSSQDTLIPPQTGLSSNEIFSQHSDTIAKLQHESFSDMEDNWNFYGNSSTDIHRNTGLNQSQRPISSSYEDMYNKGDTNYTFNTHRINHSAALKTPPPPSSYLGKSLFVSQSNSIPQSSSSMYQGPTSASVGTPGITSMQQSVIKPSQEPTQQSKFSIFEQSDLLSADSIFQQLQSSHQNRRPTSYTTQQKPSIASVNPSQFVSQNSIRNMDQEAPPSMNQRPSQGSSLYDRPSKSVLSTNLDGNVTNLTNKHVPVNRPSANDVNLQATTNRQSTNDMGQRSANNGQSTNDMGQRSATNGQSTNDMGQRSATNGQSTSGTAQTNIPSSISSSYINLSSSASVSNTRTPSTEINHTSPHISHNKSRYISPNIHNISSSTKKRPRPPPNADITQIDFSTALPVPTTVSGVQSNIPKPTLLRSAYTTNTPSLIDQLRPTTSLVDQRRPTMSQSARKPTFTRPITQNSPSSSGSAVPQMLFQDLGAGNVKRRRRAFSFESGHTGSHL